MTLLPPEEVRDTAASIQLLVIDVDGVLTDGSLWYDGDGEQLKSFHVRDGLGIRLLHREEVHVAILSARRSPPLKRRSADLRVEHGLFGRDDKLKALEGLVEDLSVAIHRVAHVGDDVLDLPVMRHVGLPIAVRDAHPLVRAEADWITKAPGGRGAVREVADGLLAARGRLEEACESLLNHVQGRGE